MTTSPSNIPAQAVEAAHEQLEAMGAYVSRDYVESALEAAAPFMLAEAWLAGRNSQVDKFIANPYWSQDDK